MRLNGVKLAVKLRVIL